MKNSLAPGALCAIALGFIAPVAFAQPAAPKQVQVVPIQAALKSGYDLLLETQRAFWDGPNGSPSTGETLAPAENLRRQRAAVENNAPVLARARQALKLGIRVPAPPVTGDINMQMEQTRDFATVREIARQFAQEADVRAADGDARGAAQSSLDAIELGAQFGRGPLLPWLVGNALNSIGRTYLLKHAPKLDAAQSREVAAQLERIEASSATLEEVLRVEQRATLNMSLAYTQDAELRAEIQAGARDAKEVGGYSPAQLRQILALTPPQLEANTAALFNAAIARAQQPYQSTLAAAPLQGADPLTSGSAGVLGATRFGFERSRLNDRLAIAALQLHAIKLETGAYPATFDAGVDPFSPTLAPLAYKRAGDKYLLYSVGPDGIDNKGAKIRSSIADPETGAEIATDRAFPDATGDIVAPVL